MAISVSGRVAIVTGASRGIGRGIAEVLAADGAKVVLVARSAADLGRLERTIAEVGGTAVSHRADVSKRDEMLAMAEACLKRFGRIDILCHNAGIFPTAPVEEVTEAMWDEINAVNLKSTLFAVQACLPAMKAQRYGRIVLTSSVCGLQSGFPGLSAYTATKAGQVGFSRSAAIEFGPHGVTINSVLPGSILTEGLAALGDDYVKEVGRTIPLGRTGDPKEVAHAVQFLASAEAGYITGQTLVVDGGQRLPHTPAMWAMQR
jgi:3-oxoacyl-[acyl-carrier protein] reductase